MEYIKNKFRTIISLYLFILLLFFIASYDLNADDWPVYKGNLYLTGNNDELIVKNNNVKWVFKGNGQLFNPVISDGMVYVIDKSARLFALDEETGAVVWSDDLIAISKTFAGTARSAGKIKYPLIRDNYLIITDATMIYAINKKNGNVIWSRTAMLEENMDFKDHIKNGINKNKPLNKKNTFVDHNSASSFNNHNAVRIDGIYSDPVLLDNSIVYGTRNVFMARDIRDGHLLWNRQDIRSYSGFPSFFDRFVFTQSMEYTENKYYLYCLNLDDGKEVWKTEIEKPFKIFSPLVYQNRVYFPSGKTLYAYDLKNGEIVFKKNYSDFITSDPSFTDQEILFSMNNREVFSVDLESGEIQNKYFSENATSPSFVLIRDQLYVASNKQVKTEKQAATFVHVDAFRKEPLQNNHQNNSQNRDNLNNGRIKNTVIWSFDAPFHGSISQPAAANGVLILPAGEYLYAIGDNNNSEIKNINDDYYVEKTDENGNKLKQDFQTWDKNKNSNVKTEKVEAVNNLNNPDNFDKNKPDVELAMRKIKLSVTDKDSNPIESDVEVIYRKNGSVIFSEKMHLDKSKNGKLIDIPDFDDVEITALSKDRAPSRETVKKDEMEKVIIPEDIKKGESFTMGKIEFELNEAYLKPEARSILAKLVQTLKENAQLKIEVRGHTDSTGNKRYNQILSQKRAESVEEFLVKNGISPLRVKSKGYGDTLPVADNETEDGRSRNRRTEFYVEK